VKYVDEFRDAELIGRTVREIRRLADPARHYRMMEVCGGHTHAIYRFGLKDLLPENVELIHGPGCPVCVLPMGRIDDGLFMAAQPDVIFAAFGDMMRVPGTLGSPLESAGPGYPHRLFAHGCVEAGARESRPARHVFRHWFRNHRAVHRAHTVARAS
jgi:hydrogenase expression/formation protein HypD